MKRHIQITGLVLLGVLMMTGSGCVTRMGDFSVISTGVPQYDRMGSAPLTPNTQAASRRFWLGPFPLSGPPTVKEAVDRCLDRAGGDFIERARIYSTDWSLLIISYGSYSVRGEVGNSKFDQVRAK
jgi:hypothetical protein